MSKEEFLQGSSLEYDLGINSFWRRARLVRAIRKNFGMGNLKVTHRDIKESKTLWELSKLIHKKLPTLADEKEYALNQSD